VGEGKIKLKNGREEHVTLHLLEGSKEEIEAQLKQSIDAFFDIYPEYSRNYFPKNSSRRCRIYGFRARVRRVASALEPSLRWCSVVGYSSRRSSIRFRNDPRRQAAATGRRRRWENRCAQLPCR